VSLHPAPPTDDPASASLASFSERHVMRSLMTCALTIPIMPRPSVTILPVTLTLASRSTLEPRSRGSTETTKVMSAEPAPVFSRPFALTRKRPPLSSISTNSAVPRYETLIAPSFTVTVPSWLRPSSEDDTSVAPGRQVTTSSGVVR
jgi:hypothetical protein